MINNSLGFQVILNERQRAAYESMEWVLSISFELERLEELHKTMAMASKLSRMAYPEMSDEEFESLKSDWIIASQAIWLGAIYKLGRWPTETWKPTQGTLSIESLLEDSK